MRAALAVLAVLTAVLLQGVVLAPLPLPGAGRPDLVLVVVVAFALAQGPAVGMAVGFGAGLLLDLLGDHPAGLLALVLCLVGYGCGVVADEADRSTLAPLLIVAAAAVAATVGYAALSALGGDPRVSWVSLSRALPSTVAYDVILAPLVVPLVAAGSSRLDPAAAQRSTTRPDPPPRSPPT